MRRQPSVTAVMITGLHEARYPLCRIAIECFCRQTYDNCQLLIINHGPISLDEGRERVIELRVEKSPEQTVGDLRNIAFDQARGEFLIVWDDDDWYAPDRIEAQMAAQDGNRAVLLKRQIRYSLIDSTAYCKTRDEGIAGTILYPRAVKFRYPSLVRGSDTEFLKCFGETTVIDAPPSLYVRFYHGLNLWGADHVMRKRRLFGWFRPRLALKPKDKRLVQEILKENAEIYRRIGWSG